VTGVVCHRELACSSSHRDCTHTAVLTSTGREAGAPGRDAAGTRAVLLERPPGHGGAWTSANRSRNNALDTQIPASCAHLELTARRDIDDRQEHSPGKRDPERDRDGRGERRVDLARLILAPTPHSIRLTAAKYVATSRSPGTKED
jgi:hypothetical protein